MAGRYDFTLDQGATFSQVFQVTDASGTAITLSSYTVAMQGRRRHQDSSVDASFTCAVTDAQNGKFTVSLTATQSAAIPANKYFYDIEITTGTTVTRLIEGTFEVYPEVTR